MQSTQIRTVCIALSLWALTGWAAAAPAAAAEHVVTQKAKAFSTKQIRAKVGDRIVFRNDDTLPHNVFSLSERQSFDLGTTSRGVSREIVLAKDGRLEIECAIYPEMTLVVDVTR